MFDSILISKILTALAYPVGLMFVFVVLSKLLAWSRRDGLARFCKLGFWLVLMISTNPIFANWLAGSLERQYPQYTLSSIEQHDAIIVLGGGLAIPLSPALHAQLSQGSDRYWHATRLYKAGKAKKIFITGGNLFRQKNQRGVVLLGEASYARQLLVEWGVASDDIVVEETSRTTQQNRTHLSGLLKQHNVNTALLVTSAMHMPRAYRLFSALPLQLTPASADIVVTNAYAPWVFKWLPSASAMARTTRASHEYYGLFVLKVSEFFNGV